MLSDFSVSDDFQAKDYPLKIVKKFEGNPVLTVQVKLSCNNAGGVPAPKGLIEVAPVPAKCRFLWRSYSSSWSSISSKYANYGQSLSSLHEGEDARHQHPPLEATPPKPGKGPLLLRGRVVAAAGLPKADSDGTDSFVVVNIGSKRAKKERKKKSQSEVIHDTSDPVYDYPFNFGMVHKGQFVEFTIFQRHKVFADQPIGYARKAVAELEFDSTGPIDIQLGEPTRFKGLPWTFTEWGKLSVELVLTTK